MAKRVKVYVLDEHEAVRRALAAQLDAAGLAVVGDSDDVERGLADIRALQPHVVLIETKRTDGRGLEAVRRAAVIPATVCVMVLTSYYSEWERAAARRAGANCYLVKQIGTQSLVELIQTAVVLRKGRAGEGRQSGDTQV